MVFNQVFFLFDSFPVSNETFPAGGGGGRGGLLDQMEIKTTSALD